MIALLAIAAACAGIEIQSDSLTAQEAQAYCSYAQSERRKVEAYWGGTWKEPIRIHVDRSYRISRALIPGHFGNRGFMEMPLRGVRNSDGALLHEIVHVYAPNANRFLAEGLAVYLHQELAANPAFPNYGKPLHAEAQRHIAAVPSLERLNAVRTPRRLGGDLGEEAAYLLAGSFVGFLIAEYVAARESRALGGQARGACAEKQRRDAADELRGVAAAREGKGPARRRRRRPCGCEAGVEILDRVKRAVHRLLPAQPHDEQGAVEALHALVGKEALEAAGVRAEESLVRGRHVAMRADRVQDLFVHGPTLASGA